jgi:fatty-acid desaturase/protein-S-isoprenylcysteine O-methyltransferase Ste14
VAGRNDHVISGFFMTSSGGQLEVALARGTLVFLSCGCFLSFTWALIFYFARPRGFRSATGLLSVAGVAFAVIHIAAVIEKQQTLLRSALSMGLYLASAGLFWCSLYYARQARLNVAFTPSRPSLLLTGGPYTYIRHPLYASYLLYWLAGTLASPWLIVSVIVMGGFYLSALRQEERSFAASNLGEAYRDYTLRSGALIPPFYCLLGGRFRAEWAKAPASAQALEANEVHGFNSCPLTQPTDSGEDPLATLSVATAQQLQQRGLRRSIAFMMLVFHIAALASFLFLSWPNVIAFVLFFAFAINVGIGMGYHRLLTHRGYRTPKWFEYILTAAGCSALQGGPIPWIATHRLHHQHSDDPFDPHSPSHGTWWAHAGWVLSGPAIYTEPSIVDRYAPDLGRDPVHVWLTNYFFVPLIAASIIQGVIGAYIASPNERWRGAIGMMLWGTALRVVVGFHITWLVNSISHSRGSRRFNTKDDSRNNWWVALLTGGEGWHNNHHAHPVSARHGLKWYELDLNYYGIWLLSKIGLAHNVYVAKN